MRRCLLTYDSRDGLPAGACVVIGNFDGVHLGHRAVIAEAARRADARGEPLGVLTFEPHPVSFFAPAAPPFRLTPPRVKARLLKALGVRILYELRFERKIAEMAAEAFISRILVDRLAVSSVVAGRDFRFGCRRSGDMALLSRMARACGFACVEIKDVTDGGRRYSSSAIRNAVRRGDLPEATRQLGRFHAVDGVVEKGEQRGRSLGFPTANISLEGICQPAYGVYAARAHWKDGCANAIASIGVRPTFGGRRPLLEAHLFDFSGDLYGRRLSVSLTGFLRPEQRFPDSETLIAQMHRDADMARAMFANPSP